MEPAHIEAELHTLVEAGKITALIDGKKASVTADLWQQIMANISPRQAYECLKGDGELHIELTAYTVLPSLEQSRSAEYGIRMSHTFEAFSTTSSLVSKQGKALGASRTIEIDNINIEEGSPFGQGAGKKTTANLETFISQCCPEVEELTVTAVYVGTYTWVKYGFLPRQNDWNAIKRTLTERNETAYQAAAILEEEYRSIADLLQSDDPKAIREIAKNDISMIDPSDGELTTIAKYLLIGSEEGESDWRGTLNRNDQESMAIYSAYMNSPSSASHIREETVGGYRPFYDPNAWSRRQKGVVEGKEQSEVETIRALLAPYRHALRTAGLDRDVIESANTALASVGQETPAIIEKGQPLDPLSKAHKIAAGITLTPYRQDESVSPDRTPAGPRGPREIQ